jgi:hypothetical protein
MLACPTCGQALGRDVSNGVVHVPDLTEADEGSDPPGPGSRAGAPTDAADLAAFEAMWPPRNSSERPEHR